MTTSTKGKKKAATSRKEPARSKKAAAKKSGAAEPTGRGPLPLKLKFSTTGATRAALDAVARDVLQNPAIKAKLGRARSRVLSVELVEPEPEKKPNKPLPPSNRFQATIYDYTNNRTIKATGGLGAAARGRLEITESSHQPLPSGEEFEEAVKLLRGESGIDRAMSEEQLQAYPPMPPLIEATQPDGRVERTIAVGLLPSNGAHNHEIVGVNMVSRNVMRFESGAPASSRAGRQTCGLPYAAQPTTGRVFVPGQVWVTVTQGNKVLWKFLVIRPAATKGPGRSTRGAGVELRYVDYKGKRVLYRAHVPILNVHYDGDACGPFRDWQDEEGMIKADLGTDVAPGFRHCTTPATTILDTGSDTGNFLGVAIYVQGQEVVLVSEMEAGWYRYVSKWRLHADGTIRPRFGFGAVDTSSCVCNRHHHHAYWRLDFDIRTIGNNVVKEFNKPCLPGICPSNWHSLDFEVQRARNPSRKRKWRVENSTTGEGYEIIPGANDGVATTSPDAPYPQGDLWFLKYRTNEIDDGVDCTTGGGGCQTEAKLNDFVTAGESIKNQDVVVWYAGHVTHDVSHEEPGEFGHICGPELKPVNW